MDARSFDSSQRAGARDSRIIGARDRFEWGNIRYRLDVVAANIADVVEHAGGWLFDRASAGWEVSVLVDELTDDDRPMRILGAEVLDLKAVLDSGGSGRQPHAIAIAADVIDRDARTGEGLRLAMADGGIQVVGWGAGWPANAFPVDPVLHRLSAAARVFKAQALTAAGLGEDSEVPRRVDATERLCSGMSNWPPIVADLSPLS
ncbi:hypothetical protein [Nocardia sp. NPDC057668]|uniref:hypothetical protein n=1 Tax=Nocardia sp. NPDC057668 TaxID=3346202 RepID=UPI0036718022